MSEQATTERKIDRTHNRAPVTEVFKQENETLKTRLVEDNEALKVRKDALLERAKTLPVRVSNEEKKGIVTDFIKDCASLLKDAEAIRVSTKAPILEAGNIIDSLFKGFGKPVLDEGEKQRAKVKAFDLARLKEEEEEREAAAALARAEEDKARAAAAKAMKGKNTDKAIDAANEAAEAADRRAAAEAATSVKASEVTRSRGETSVSSLIEVWKGVVEDFDKCDLNKLRPYIKRAELEAAAERAAKALKENGIGAIPGVRIFKDHESRVS